MQKSNNTSQFVGWWQREAYGTMELIMSLSPHLSVHVRQNAKFSLLTKKPHKWICDFTQIALQLSSKKTDWLVADRRVHLHSSNPVEDSPSQRNNHFVCTEDQTDCLVFTY